MLSTHQLLGLDDQHILRPIGITPQAAKAFAVMEKAASQKGFQLKIISGFRSYERQKIIWEEKISGKRALVDDQENVLDPKELAPDQLLKAIIRFSAIPGFSRHHWGTDFDLIDANGGPKDYQVRLTLSETQPGGVFGEMHTWLNDYLNQNPDFYRPLPARSRGRGPGAMASKLSTPGRVKSEALDN